MALYKVLKIKDKEVKLRLRTRDCVDLERKIGESPLNVLMRASSEQKMPTVGFVVAVLHASLQAYENGYTMDKTYDLYDEYVDDGNDLTDALGLVTDIFEVSGFFKKEKAKKEEIKENTQEELKEIQEEQQELQVQTQEEKIIV